MRILHYNHTFFERSETFIKRFVEKSTTFAITAAVGDKIQNIPEELRNKAEFFQLPEMYYTRKSFNGAERFIREKLSKKLHRENELASYITHFEPDIVHCHFGPNGLYFMDILNKYHLNYPFLTTFYGFDASSLPNEDPTYKKRLTELWKKGEAFLAEGPSMAEKIVALGAPEEKVIINPLLIPMEEYPQKQIYRKPKDPIRFLLIGRFVEKKGFHLFLKALGEIQQQLPSFEVNIIGYGEMEAVYNKVIHTYNLVDKVHFWGGRDHKEVIKVLAEHDFFVHPSLTAASGDSEGGSPTIISEAQAVGIPIITSDHADIPFVMGYDNFLCRENDVYSLKEQILDAVKYSAWPELIDRGRNKIYKQHSFQSSYIYEQIIKDQIVFNK